MKRDLQRWLHKTKAPSELNQYLGFRPINLSWKFAGLFVFCVSSKK